MTRTNVGVWGLGTFMPPIVRGNDWWPDEVVATWPSSQSREVTRGAIPPDVSAGTRRLMTAAAAHAGDPFEGARERRVMPDGMWPTDMEAAAARDAMARAGVSPTDIDFLIVESTTPDFLVPDGCRLQQLLDMRTDGLFTIQTSTVCNAFVQQMALAEGLIRGGGFRLGLLVQCSVMSRHIRQSDPYSPWLGDGATAAVVGAVSGAKGLLAHAHATDGRYHGGLVFGVPGKRWYEDGPVIFHIEDQQKARAMVQSIADETDALVTRMLGEAGLRRDQVDFFAAHQGMVWLGRAMQEHLGLDRARRVDTFPWAASIMGANVPLVLATAEREGQLRDGDVVLAFSGAPGQTVSTLVARWGR
jgi:3-oxoacyl-[acyl-carrier-protein] synthase III